jgi:hypothetical protein
VLNRLEPGIKMGLDVLEAAAASHRSRRGFMGLSRG